MEWSLINSAAILIAVINLGIAVFQVLLTLGYPLGEAAMGGKYKVLPKPLRVVSAGAAIILLFFGFVFLEHTNVIRTGIDFLPTSILVWVWTVYMGVNTLGNLVSKSKKERVIMTPISSLVFILCLYVAILH
jgi:hypothetical protein